MRRYRVIGVFSPARDVDPEVIFTELAECGIRIRRTV